MRQIDQRVFGFGIRQRGQVAAMARSTRLLRLLARFIDGVALEDPLLERGDCDILLVGGGETASLLEIDACCLAELLGIARQVEHVVDDLERQPDVVAEIAERLDVLGCAVGEPRAELAGGAEQRGGLEGDNPVVDLAGEVVLLDGAGLQRFAFDQRDRRVGEDDVQVFVRVPSVRRLW